VAVQVVHAECDGEDHFRDLFVRQGLADDDKRLVISAPDMNEWELLWAGNDRLVDSPVSITNALLMKP
jgi:hypothetical protein